VIELAGESVTTLLDPADGRLGCARSAGGLAVRCHDSFAWLVVEEGRGRAELDGTQFGVAGRNGVFERPGWSALLAPGSRVELDGSLATTVVWRRADGFATSTRVIDPSDVVEETRGDGVTRRRVRTYVADGPLVVGETINPPGGWSSWPPHSHDHEELYLYRFEPASGFGVHVDLSRSPITVRDGDVPTVDTRISPNFAF
jgi:5-deoxy-glucuronate isomerase